MAGDQGCLLLEHLAKSDGFNLPFWVDTTPQSLAAHIANGQDPYFA